MANTVPLSYALFLIGKDRELGDVLTMECESGNLKEEQDQMMFHKLVLLFIIWVLFFKKFFTIIIFIK